MSTALAEASKPLRSNGITAARDMHNSGKLIEVEDVQHHGKIVRKEFFTVKRNRRDALPNCFSMFTQVFGGVNVITYYSTSIFRQAGFATSEALLASFDTGLIN